MITKLLIQHRF